VVFASWIVNWPVNLEPVLDAARTVITVSKNSDGTMCGYPEMWELLRRRHILAYVPDVRNTVTVYGDQTVVRNPTGEERAGIDHDRLFAFSDCVSPSYEDEVVRPRL